MILAHIVAAAENGVIGAGGALPWDIPEDMKFFKDKTKGKIIIMGRKTFESVGHPLPKRLNLVVTRQADFQAKDAFAFPNLEEAIAYAKTRVSEYDPEVFIIGGGEIYAQSMNLVDRIYLTRIHKNFPGDAKYPPVPESRFRLVDKKERSEPIPFTFLTYERLS